jgi:hypothetical protein
MMLCVCGRAGCSATTTTGQLRPDDRNGLGKRNSRGKAKLKIERADEVM